MKRWKILPAIGKILFFIGIVLWFGGLGLNIAGTLFGQPWESWTVALAMLGFIMSMTMALILPEYEHNQPPRPV